MVHSVPLLLCIRIMWASHEGTCVRMLHRRLVQLPLWPTVSLVSPVPFSLCFWEEMGIYIPYHLHHVAIFFFYRYPGLYDAESTAKAVRNAYDDWINARVPSSVSPGSANAIPHPTPESM